MSDGAAGASPGAAGPAPTAAPAPGSGAPASGAAPTKSGLPVNQASTTGKAAPKAALAKAGDAKPTTESKPAWDDSKEEAFIGMLKDRSEADPTFRIKVNGKELKIESREDFNRWKDNARRGTAASQMVEESNAKVAKAQKVMDLQKAIQEGDDDAAEAAILELGGERAVKLLMSALEKQQARAAQEAELSPEAREWKAQAEARDVELKQYRAKAEQQAAEAKKAEDAKARADVMTEGRTLAKTVLETLGLDSAEAFEEMHRPVTAVMRAAAAEGIDLKALPKEELHALVEQEVEQDSFRITKQLKTDEARAKWLHRSGMISAPLLRLLVSQLRSGQIPGGGVKAASVAQPSARAESTQRDVPERRGLGRVSGLELLSRR